MRGAPARIVGAAGLVVGVGMAVRPPASVRTGGPDALVARVLGARTAMQGASVIARPTRTVLVAAAVVDLLHAASMVAAARIWPQRHDPALASAALAAGFALAELTSRPARSS